MSAAPRTSALRRVAAEPGPRRMTVSGSESFCCWRSGGRQQPQDGFYQPLRLQVTPRAEEISPLDRRERPSRSQVNIRDFTVVEAYRYEPRDARRPEPQLVDGQQQFLRCGSSSAGPHCCWRSRR